MAEFLRKRNAVLDMFRDMGASEEELKQESLKTFNPEYTDDWFAMIL
jgi:hypothetical protein